MESNFNNREFEQYVKTNADQYRMIPSEKVWKGINNTLHTRRKWYGFGLGFLLLLTAISVTWVMVSYPANKKQQIAATNDNLRTAIQTQPAVKKTGNNASKDIRDLLSINRYSKQETVIPADQTYGPANDISPIDQLIDNRTADAEFLMIETDRLPSVVSSRKTTSSPVTITGIIDFSDLLDITNPDRTNSDNTPVPVLPETRSLKNKTNPGYYPLTIESVVNVFHKNKISRKMSWQVYFTPTVSYRKWSINKSYNGPASSFSTPSYPFASLRDVNSEVVHKPDMGLELGVSTKYPITKNLKLTGGLQFNINRYDIKAFASSGEQATINLSGGNGNNSVTAWTYYRNYNGYRSDWLKSFYFSVSAPIGAELRLLGNDKTSFGIAGTLQPSYILKDRAFLISTDYKNYVEMPRLVRHLNLNTSFETFVSYMSRNGKSSWQIGPQVRYQALSSFQKKYPVKENLFDFGLKVGLTF